MDGVDFLTEAQGDCGATAYGLRSAREMACFVLRGRGEQRMKCYPNGVCTKYENLGV